MKDCYREQKALIKKLHFDTKIDDIPVTGRSLNYYLKSLFVDFKNKTDLIKYLKSKKFVDIGSGVNHIYNKSLLYELIHKKYKAYGLDIAKVDKNKHYLQKSIFTTKIQSNSCDILAINNLLYFHLHKKNQIKRALKEMHRILKKDGELRIFPIFYGNYYLGDEDLKEFINKFFFIRILNPKNLRNENPIFLIDNEIIKGSQKVGIQECKIMEKLNSKVVIFKKFN